ncbi:ribulose-phosphate 3-epimerase [Sodalis-like secondary symbiont of Drepanosiphum platanoidis]|uniref:ribulose-phosphate 3-epimerase n=1 Tax=Sodalis-like secondary symbiont of Drepanosiphum platanoidis TaxID=2994493 RepID=UPI00346393B0
MKKHLISPSIISANFSCLGKDISKVISSGADMIHFDVMDNHYVPNITMGPFILESIRSYGINVPIDVHLMTNPVDNLIEKFIFAGANYIIFHPESTLHLDKSLNLIKNFKCKSGLAFNPSTSLNYLEYVIEKIDIILIMGVNPGFSGQSFIPNTINKIKNVRKIIDNIKPNILLAVDGGININNISSISKAGANIFISGSEIFGSNNYLKIISSMKKKISCNF